ncbi:YheC/YheD family protein [Guptibacillus algicola]|uniref:YheC/YheD family endospore coat-associated protein n=1 Tax=Guptibacillus algicola TaxID=225844 RepID=UPI001CD27A2E|nr:YheC/YheD family protein [Alkalihalobacillus algicola]MCA0989214.1 YheC/YheD family protein [Alkalihalobacillus algicola]
MIQLFYDNESNKWSQRSTYQILYWGKEQLSLSPPSTKSVRPIIKVNSNKNGIRPLVGILAGDNSNYHFSGNTAIFTSIQNEITKHGGLSFVFTPSSIRKTYITGYIFDETTKKWTGYRFPYPNIVYNRIPTRKEESSRGVRNILNYLDKKELPYFNKRFLNKADLYRLLNCHDEVKPYLPNTELLTPDNLEPFLLQNPTAYCKPSTGSKGHGIFKLEATANGYKYSDHDNSICFDTINDLSSYLQPKLKEVYLIQKAVSLSTHGNYRYDFRVLLQKPYNFWQVTGIGIRANEKEHLTTHVPRGGRIFSFDKIADHSDEIKIKKLALTTASLIDHEGLFAELSMDIGKDSNDDLWIFEVNAKPMRFDEPSIHQASISSLISAFRTFSAY